MTSLTLVALNDKQLKLLSLILKNRKINLQTQLSRIHIKHPDRKAKLDEITSISSIEKEIEAAKAGKASV